MEKGKLGYPKYKVDDTVYFNFVDKNGNTIKLTGKVYIVDAYGTFEQNEEPSYDIMAYDFNGQNCLFKHIRESGLLDG